MDKSLPGAFWVRWVNIWVATANKYYFLLVINLAVDRLAICYQLLTVNNMDVNFFFIAVYNLSTWLLTWLLIQLATGQFPDI